VQAQPLSPPARSCTAAARGCQRTPHSLVCTLIHNTLHKQERITSANVRKKSGGWWCPRRTLATRAAVKSGPDASAMRSIMIAVGFLTETVLRGGSCRNLDTNSDGPKQADLACFQSLCCRGVQWTFAAIIRGSYCLRREQHMPLVRGCRHRHLAWGLHVAAVGLLLQLQTKC
jgi:hypothetical protein